MIRTEISVTKYLAIMLGLFLLEAAMLTVFGNLFDVYLSPVVLFIIALSAGIVPLFFKPVAGISTPKGWHPLLHAGLLIFATIVVCGMMNNIIHRNPIDVRNSDIIPQMDVLASRFLAGDMPYQPITEWGWTMFPTYQPLQWLPFTIAKLGQFDFRWIGIAFWLGAVFLYQWKLSKNRLHPVATALLCLAPFLVVAGFYQYNWAVLAYTVELLIAAFYVFLAFSIRSRSVWAIGGGILLCLLSRYSLIFWLPLYFLVLLLNWDRKKTLLASGVVVAGVLLIYVLPFMSRDWGIFLKGYQYHSGAALGEWMHNADDGKAYHLFQGVGFACYFYDFVGGELADKLKLLQRIHLLVCIATVAGLGWWYYKRLRHYIPIRVFLLCSLKVYLVVFYTFIQIPYTYLMLVPLFVSLPLLLPGLVGEDEVASL